jgi:hypothetical protein
LGAPGGGPPLGGAPGGAPEGTPGAPGGAPLGGAPEALGAPGALTSDACASSDLRTIVFPSRRFLDKGRPVGARPAPASPSLESDVFAWGAALCARQTCLIMGTMHEGI